MSNSKNDFKETKRELKQKLISLEELIGQLEEKLDCKSFSNLIREICLFI
jgi:hypothetical protein